jgi:hypothetical protein
MTAIHDLGSYRGCLRGRRNSGSIGLGGKLFDAKARDLRDFGEAG